MWQRRKNFMFCLNEMLYCYSIMCLRCGGAPVCLRVCVFACVFCTPASVFISAQYLWYPQGTQPPTWQRIRGLWGDCQTGRSQISCHWRWPPLGEGCSHSVYLDQREEGQRKKGRYERMKQSRGERETVTSTSNEWCCKLRRTLH